MNNSARVLVVIPARGGSTRVPLKNIALVAGRPSLAYAVDALRESHVHYQAVLITDHPRIAEVGRELNLDVIEEPPDLANDNAVDETKLIRLALASTGLPDTAFQYILLHYACVPVRPPGIVDTLIQFLHETGADLVQTAAPVDSHQHPYRMVTRTPDGRMSDYVPEGSLAMSQNYPPLCFRTAAGFGMRVDSFTRLRGNFFDASEQLDRRCVLHAASDCVDIDEPEDVVWAEYILNRRHQA